MKNFLFFLLNRIMLIKSDIRSSCRIVPGLSREQLDLCYKANDVTTAALDGLDLAIRECQLQVSVSLGKFRFGFNPIIPTRIRTCTYTYHISHIAYNYFIDWIHLVPVASLELFIAQYQKT